MLRKCNGVYNTGHMDLEASWGHDYPRWIDVPMVENEELMDRVRVSQGFGLAH